MTRASGVGCWMSMYPPPVWVKPTRVGVIWACRSSNWIDTGGAAAGAWVTVIVTGVPGATLVGSSLAIRGSGNRTAPTNPARILRITISGYSNPWRNLKPFLPHSLRESQDGGAGSLFGPLIEKATSFTQ